MPAQRQQAAHSSRGRHQQGHPYPSRSGQPSRAPSSPPAWLHTAADKSGPTTWRYQTPEGDFCVGVAQRKTEAKLKNHVKREADAYRDMCTCHVEHCMLDASDKDFPTKFGEAVSLFLLPGHNFTIGVDLSSREEEQSHSWENFEAAVVDNNLALLLNMEDSDSSTVAEASDPSFDAGHAMQDVQAPASRAHRRPNVGISLTLSLVTNNAAMADRPIYLHLSYKARVLSIDLRSLSDTTMARLDGLAWLLRTNVVTLHAYHAADVCARLACINFTTLIYDMATAVRVYEKRDLVQVCRLLCESQKKDSKPLEPFFASIKGGFLDYGLLPGIREAYFCGVLATMVRLNRCATSKGKNPALVSAIEGMYREMSLSRPSPVEERPLEWDLLSSKPVPGRIVEEGDNAAPYFSLHCLKQQQMPLPSRSEVVIFRLAYLYYTENDELRQGQACEGLYTDLYGQVFRVDGKEAHVHFPAGIRVMATYNHIPFSVFKNTRLGRHQEHGAFPAYLMPDRNPRLVIKGVSLVGQAEPNAEELLRHEHALLLLAPSPPERSDRSNLARFLCPPFACSMEDYKTNLDLAFKTSVFSHIGDKLTEMDNSGLDHAQRGVLEAVLAPNVDAVACLGGPGCGKTYLIAQILLRWDALVHSYPTSKFEENYVERFTLRTGKDKSAIEWLPSVKRLRPLVVVLHQTNEALANCARAVKAIMANFVLIKSQRVDGFTDHCFYQDFEAQARSVGEFVTASKTARTLGEISVVLCTKGAFFAVSHNLCKVGQPAMFLADESRQLSATSLCTALQQAALVSKVVVFGDMEQLPQYRSNLMPDQLSALESVHRLALANPWLYAELKVQTHFLGQSRRLPVALTHFLSKEVYQGQLRDGTNTPPQETTMGSHDGYLRFVYCDDSSEEQACTSRRNPVEARAVVKIACLFRSLNVNLSIVTPYLAQKALIEELLAKQTGWSASSDSHGLAADATVFTIDSYQGRENNAILFSPVVTGVRVDGPEPFVMDKHRQTVALSRCKEFLVVVTNQRFLQQAHTRKPTILTKLHSQTVGWQYNDDVRPLRDWIRQQKEAPGYDV